MFEKCKKCGRELRCQDEYASLKPGYWWRWRDNTLKDRYKLFIANLLAASPALGEDDVRYPYTLPKPYKCPAKESCKGGIDSTCTDGYKGPLCSVCTKGYYKHLHRCKTCPSKAWIAGQLSIISIILFIIVPLCVWKRKSKTSEGKRSVIDMFLTKVKIAIGFYQVTYGLLEAFSYIEWPDTVRIVGKYSEILQFNILQIAPVHCLFLGLQTDAFANLFAIMITNATFIAVAGIVYGARKVTILRNGSLTDDVKAQKISQVKEAVYRNLFFFLYVTYLNTCSKTATVIPLACRKICSDENEISCLQYLKADYSVQCHDPWYRKLVIVAYVSTAYVLALPTATFIILWRRQRKLVDTGHIENESEEPDPRTEIIKGLHFLYGNYKDCFWYWEMIEMSRKVVVTSVLVLLGQESRSYIGITWVVAGMYGVFFAWNRPIQDAFENALMTTSLVVTVLDLGLGAISKIPAENLPTSTHLNTDTVIFNILILGANTLVIALLACKMIFCIGPQM